MFSGPAGQWKYKISWPAANPTSILILSTRQHIDKLSVFRASSVSSACVLLEHMPVMSLNRW